MMQYRIQPELQQIDWFKVLPDRFTHSRNRSRDPKSERIGRTQRDSDLDAAPLGI